MKHAHFETFAPICAACRAERSEEHGLVLSVTSATDGTDVREGILECPACRREYPIIDGIPLLVPDVRAYLASQLANLTSRDDLSPAIGSMIGEAAGSGSAYDVARVHLSSYAWDHYGDLDPKAAEDQSRSNARPGAVVRALDAALALAQSAQLPVLHGPITDVGCAVGRTTFELAKRTEDLVLGLDLGFQFLRVASRVLRDGEVQYPLRRVGLLYDWRRFAARFEGAERVDFWACDAAHLPFPSGSLGSAMALNVLDCVYAPLDMLRSIARAVREGGGVVVGSPYDWTPAATAVEAWIGGHSPRSLGDGASDAVLRALLTPGAHAASVDGLELVAERDDVPWTVRLHDRSTVHYRLHMVAAARR